MADFSLTTLFVVPFTQANLAPLGVISTQDLGAGVFGFFEPDYTIDVPGGTPGNAYFYIAQGRANTYLQGSKRSDKIKGCVGTLPQGLCNTNVTEFYKVAGCSTAAVQITDVGSWNVQCGDIVTLTIRAHSSYIDTLYFNGLTRSVTVQVPCCDCIGDPCSNANYQTLVDNLIAKLRLQAPGNNPDNISLNNFFTFERISSGPTSVLRITGKPLTKYGVPCDVAAFPHEYDRMWFRVFVYEGPATTVDFIVADNCNIVAVPNVIQRSSYPTGTSEEIRQLEKNYYSYQAGYLKHLYRMGGLGAGYNQNFESYVADNAVYDTYYIKYNTLDRSEYNWGDFIPQDQMVIIAAPTFLQVPAPAGDISGLITTYLSNMLGPSIATAVNACITTTSTTSAAPTTTTTTTGGLIP